MIKRERGGGEREKKRLTDRETNRGKERENEKKYKTEKDCQVLVKAI